MNQFFFISGCLLLGATTGTVAMTGSVVLLIMDCILAYCVFDVWRMMVRG